MSNPQSPDISPESLTAQPPSAREPWVPPALESLDVSETMVKTLAATDGGLGSSTHS